MSFLCSIKLILAKEWFAVRSETSDASRIKSVVKIVKRKLQSFISGFRTFE